MKRRRKRRRNGTVKTWETETGKLLQTFTEHTGWVTDFVYWAQAKLMLSSSNDGLIIVLGSGGGMVDKINIGMPIYCMALNTRREQLVCGVKAGIRVYDFDESKECGHVVNNEVLYVAREHTDIVRSIVCYESRIYSAGYDQKIVIYDCSFTGDNSMEAIFVIHRAHDAGISCLVLARDNENQWIITGSFDKTVKLWSTDGKLIHKLDNFLSTITGICYVPRNKTVWVAGGSSYANLFDPKSGDNVSDFIGTFHHQEEEKYQLQHLKFFPEFNQVVASTSRRHMIVWKYQMSSCVTALKCRFSKESLCYTRKVPILIFSGDSEGVIMKWERMQSNHFMYSKEVFLMSDNKLKKKKRAGSKARELMIEQQMLSQVASPPSRSGTASSGGASKNIKSHYAFNKPIIPPVSTHNHPNTSILKIVYVESVDFILAASEDSNIYVWGVDDAAVEVLKNMKPQDFEALVKKYAVLLDSESELLPKNASKLRDGDSVTNRVAGFVCRYVFSEHTSCVTSLVVVGREHGQDSTYVLSGGWDRRICIWNLEEGQLHDNFRSPGSQPGPDSMELACDGVILSMDYSPKNNEFAYASSDKMVYIRRFSSNGSKMTLVNTLQGHEGEITCVQWNPVTDKWVTGSEDGTVRIWSSTGMNECEVVLSVQGAVGCLCMDKVHGAIIAGVQNNIRIYEAEFHRLVQSNVGHTETVRSIIHIPERNQYVSCSLDHTIRVWNAWKLRRRKQNVKISTKHETDEENKLPPAVEKDGEDVEKTDEEKTIEAAEEGEKA